MSEEKAAASIKLSYTSKDLLYASFIPLLRRGGLFIPTTRVFALHERLHLSVTLPDSDDVFSCQGEVVWVTPKNADMGMPQGVGVHFDNSAVSEKLQTMIGAALVSMSTKKATYTF